MKIYSIAIIGGGASGLILATSIKNAGEVALFERGERVGRKLSATGNGQGNITNLAASRTEYFSVNHGVEKAQRILCEYDEKSMMEYFIEKGVLLIWDERDRVYPAGRQASAVTDALRFDVAKKGIDLRLGEKIVSIEKSANGFILTSESANGTQRCQAKKVVLCAGGKAAANFGTDGSAYALAKKLGHTVTPLYPSLVQLKTDTTHTKTLKGIRVNGGKLSVQTGKGEPISFIGDIIFTDYGVSGDAVFRASAFIASDIEGGSVKLSIDFLPTFTEERVLAALRKKKENYPDLAVGELLCGMVNNQIGRAVMKRAGGDIALAAKLVKDFPLNVTGSLGFDYAQVTKGGIPLKEVDDDLQSVFTKGFYFAGEILDVDGPCGGFNLQWAYSSARAVADAIQRSLGDDV